MALASHRGYIRCVHQGTSAVRDMWSGTEAEGLDWHASNEALRMPRVCTSACCPAVCARAHRLPWLHAHTV
eukprot:5858995-Pyramimonas_sp.AAC.2